MQIPNLGTEKTPGAQRQPVGAVGAGRRNSRAGSDTTDAVQTSAESRFAQELVARIKAEDETVRPEIIAKFRRLMDLGALDSPQSAERAARALLGDQD